MGLSLLVSVFRPWEDLRKSQKPLSRYFTCLSPNEDVSYSLETKCNRRTAPRLMLYVHVNKGHNNRNLSYVFEVLVKMDSVAW
jgi:hypothetical protein